MFDDHHDPPRKWQLILKADQNAPIGSQAAGLKLARRIIWSYFDPKMFRRRRLEKGIHHYELDFIDDVIHRSVLTTIEEETWPIVKATKRWEEGHVW